MRGRHQQGQQVIDQPDGQLGERQQQDQDQPDERPGRRPRRGPRSGQDASSGDEHGEDRAEVSRQGMPSAAATARVDHVELGPNSALSASRPRSTR